MKGKVGRFLKSNVLIVFLVILVVVITVLNLEIYL